MKRKRSIATLVLVCLLLAGALAFDLSRPRWLRVTTSLFAIIDDLTGIAIIADPRRASSENPVRAYSVPDPLAVKDPCNHPVPVWLDVQTGQFGFVRRLGVEIVSPGCLWDMRPDQFFARFEELNPEAVRLPHDSHPVPRFLIMQKGGGVEGLSLQVVLTADGLASIWELPWLHGVDVTQLPSERNTQVPPSAVERLFQLASDADLSSQRRVEWRYNVLDGGVQSVALFDGRRLGRVHHVNSVEPAGALRELVTSMEALADSHPTSSSDRERGPT